MIIPASKINRGIETSVADKTDVRHLYVEAKEANEFFYWSKSTDQAVLKLKALFPKLERITIEDDYLIQSQIDALITQLPPIAVEWTYRIYIDSRYGR